MTGKVRSIRVLAQSVIVGFPDGSQAEVPLDQLTWEGVPRAVDVGGPEMAPQFTWGPRLDPGDVEPAGRLTRPR